MTGGVSAVSDVAVRVAGLGKQYRLGETKERYTTLRDQIRKWTSLRRLLRRARGAEGRPTFWALRDVSFEVRRGEVVGVIGRNGAGKSTLLKILSRITEPTEGEADIHGRVGSLLEVGTGFHPELTGRENIYLNGAILGMKRVEITRKFEDIVGFAEVEQFIDTPVKHYSSGMYTRLAFAVAAHLEPEILVVDEVLAVGDAEFQKKCLGKMGEVARGGRTVLFVSHNMSAVQALCRTAVVLEQGAVARIGPATEAVAFYLNRHAPGQSFVRDREPAGVGIVSAELALTEAEAGPILTLTVVVQSDHATAVTLDLRLYDRAGTPVGFGSLGTLNPTSLVHLTPGWTRVTGQFDGASLAVGGYLVGLDLTYPDASYLDRLDNCLTFELHPPPRPPAVRRLHQQWGVGNYELRSVLVAAEPTPLPDRPRCAT